MYCDKEAYSKHRAEEVKRDVQRRRNVKIRVYKCDRCHEFHLTSNTRDL
jgi:hypothetical protein